MSYENEAFLSPAVVDKLQIGTCIQSEHGQVYQIENILPSIGGTGEVRFVFRSLRSGKELDWNFNEMRYHRLKIIDPEEVPLALLGAT